MLGANGLQGLRLFTPCSTGTCDIFESPKRVRLTSPRWYPSSVSGHFLFDMHHHNFGIRYALKTGPLLYSVALRVAGTD
jgi:hypothetical protein